MPTLLSKAARPAPVAPLGDLAAVHATLSRLVTAPLSLRARCAPARGSATASAPKNAAAG